MKNLTTWASILAILLSSCAGGCAGSAARQNVQLPAIKATWAQLRKAVERQVAIEHEDATDAALIAADRAIEAGDPVQILAVDWKRIETAVELDVARQLAASEIGPLGAETRRGLLTQFAEERALYTRTSR